MTDAKSIPCTSTQQHRDAARETLQLAIITVSDSRTLATDKSGSYLQEAFLAAGHGVVSRQIVADEIEQIRTAVLALCQDAGLDAILLTGGTGLSPRDRTPEALQPLFDMEIPGFGELFRWLSFKEIGSATILSRATAGKIGSVLVFCLPGSTPAVRLATEQILITELPHLVHHSKPPVADS